VPVNGTEAKPNSLAPPFFGDSEVSAIPRNAFVIRSSDAAEFALPWEGHNDAERKRLGSGGKPIFLDTDIVRVKSEFPNAVQIKPLRSLKIWSRVFKSRNEIGAYCVPCCHQSTRYRRHKNPPPHHRPQSPHSDQCPFLSLKDDAKIFGGVNGTEVRSENLVGGALAPNLIFHGAKQEPDPPNHRLKSVATKTKPVI
jgi:hypothetical protein